MKTYLIPTLFSLYAGTALAVSMPDFEQLDSNVDGKLTKQEIAGAIRDFNFERADKNGDGVINREEYTVVQKEKKQTRS